MKKHLLMMVFLALIAAMVEGKPTTAVVDISGTWVFSVDLESGAHGDPTFIFKQDKEALMGTYEGPLGQFKVEGTIKENNAVFGFEFTTEGVTRKASYTATVESATKMSGTMELSPGPKGKWTATKK